MGFQDVAFIYSQGNFSTTFLKNCGRDESLLTFPYHRNVVGGMQGYASCRIPLL